MLFFKSLIKKADDTAYFLKSGIIYLILCPFVVYHGTASAGPAASGTQLARIYEIYHLEKAPERGIELLTDAILDGRLEYTTATLQDTILPMMKDYFIWETRKKVFENLIYRFVDYDNIGSLRRYFMGSDLLAYVENAFQEWKTPSYIEIDPQYTTLEVGESIAFAVKARNNLDKPLMNVDFDYFVSPRGRGEFDPETKVFTARGAGEVRITLVAQGLSGEVRANVKLNILARPVSDP